MIASPSISRLIKNEIIPGLEREAILHDFGDYSPFMYAYGETEFVEQHLELLKSKTSEFTRPYRLTRSTMTFDYNYEIILGLIEIYRLSRQELFLHYAEKHMETCLSYFLYRKVVVSRYYGMPSFLVSYYAYIMVELLLDLYEVTERPKYIEISQRLVFEFLRRESQREALFGNYDYLFLRKLGKSIVEPNGFFIGKNTTIFFGLTKLAAVTGDEKLRATVKKYLLEINELMVKDRITYRYIRLNSRIVRDPCISASFMYINMLNYYTSCFDDQSTLRIAEDVASPYVESRGVTGLFPYRIGSDRRCFIDGNTDFSMALIELFQLTGKKRYRDLAVDCYNGILAYNLSYSSVDVESGEAAVPVVFKAYRTRAKFKALFLKLSLSIENKLKIIGANSYASLVRDR